MICANSYRRFVEMKAFAAIRLDKSIAKIAVMIAAVSGIMLAGPASAQMSTADPRRGRELAERLCMGCHIVAPNSANTANPDVPSFPSIARKDGVTAERLAGRIIVPHPAMPKTQLTVAEIRDIVAYILTLKP
jgi:mono/diheme cytochrome c family protein